MTNVKFYQDMSVEIHAHCVAAGWWNAYPNKTSRKQTASMLIVSELAEAMEGDRKSLMDDHLPEYKAFDVELADAAIRCLDWLGAMESKFRDFNIALRYNIDYLNDFDFTVVEQLNLSCSKLYNVNIMSCLICIIAVAKHNNVDLEKLIRLKFEYNKTRSDHKKEIRELEKHGKKY